MKLQAPGIGAGALGVLAILATPAAAQTLAPPAPPALQSASTDAERIVVFADSDDDDDDGIADATDRKLGKTAEDGQVLWLPTPRATSLPNAVFRLLSHEGPWVSGRTSGRMGLQGLQAGRDSIALDGKKIDVEVVEVLALDGRGARVELATSHAAITRTLPLELGGGFPLVESDPDALRWVFLGHHGTLPERVSLRSTRQDGKPLDGLEAVELLGGACPDGTDAAFECVMTPLIRATSDRIDRTHPEASQRSLRAEVGGRILVSVGSRQAAGIRVGGPRATAIGPIGRLRGKLRVHVFRLAPGGMPAVGGDDPGALALARAEVDTASGLWGQCGIHFGTANDQEIVVRDPPPPYLLAVGCELGLPASGGELHGWVDNQRFRLVLSAGEAPVEVAERLSRLLSSMGFAPVVSVNPRVPPAALPTADVLVRRRDGVLATLRTDNNAPVSSDPTLGACIGEVNLADGLAHFTDADAASGTLEERTLIKAFEDSDPSTIEVFIVPAFGGSGRIGESFIDSARSSIQNVIVLDRAGIRAGARSFAMAHELGHVLLDMPGHPDDYGVDQPSALMDADAADPSIFGPRRLSIAECERAVIESGPRSRMPLLVDWPLYRTPRVESVKATSAR